MSIQLNSRQIQVLIRSNNGNNYQTVPKGPAKELDVSSYLVQLGDINWSVDDQLTKMSLGDISLTLTDDPEETVWSFLTEDLIVTDPISLETYGILPPWLILVVDGVTVFKGLIKETPTRSQESGTLEIAVQAVDWSSMLEYIVLGPPERLVNVTGNTAQSATVDCTSYPFYIRVGGVAGASLEQVGVTCVRVAAALATGLKAGRLMYIQSFTWGPHTDPILHEPDGVTHKVYGPHTYTYNKSYRIDKVAYALNGDAFVYLGDGFAWPKAPFSIPTNSSTFFTTDHESQSMFETHCYMTGEASTVVDVIKNPLIYTVATAWTPATTSPTLRSIKLDKVAGIFPGDKLTHPGSLINTADSSFDIVVVDVNATTNTIYLEEAIDKAITTSTTFVLSEESSSEQYMTTMQSVLDKVCTATQVCRMDYTNFHPQALGAPCFGFVSLTSPAAQNGSETVTSIVDMKANATNFSIRATTTTTAGWTGTPDTGWTSATFDTSIPWNRQVSTVPASLMGWVTPPTLQEYRSPLVTTYPGYNDGRTSKEVNGRVDDRSRDASYKFVWDYSAMRMYKFYWNVQGNPPATCHHWNGTSYDNVSGTWINPARVLDICPLPGSTGVSGGGMGLVALKSTGTIRLFHSTQNQEVTLAGNEATRLDARSDDVHLVQTPSALYYLTPTGYGKIFMDGATLSSKFMTIAAPAAVSGASVTLLTNTTTLSGGSLWSLAKVSYKASPADTTLTSDLYLIQLPAEIPDSPAGAILYADKVSSGISRTTALVKHPTSDLMIGCVDNRLFQISTTLPSVIERFAPEGQSLNSVLEYIGAVTNTVIIPTVDGTIRLHTRGYNPTPPVALTIDIVSQVESVWYPNITSCVVIKGKDCEEFVISDIQKAGLTLSYENEVYIRNSSQARALAKSYLAFFEKPRKQIEMVWYSQTAPTQWESIKPMDTVTINGGPEYHCLGLSWSYQTLQARATLLEVL